MNFFGFRNISPTDSYLVGFFAIGEGWHNYHVSFKDISICLIVIKNNIQFYLFLSCSTFSRKFPVSLSVEIFAKSFLSIDFSWDYKTAELPGYMFNISTAFIDFFAWIGWATELKTVPENLIQSRIVRTGDGSHPLSKEKLEGMDDNNNDDDDASRDVEHFWGFGDDTMTKQDMKNIKIL